MQKIVRFGFVNPGLRVAACVLFTQPSCIEEVLIVPCDVKQFRLIIPKLIIVLVYVPVVLATMNQVCHQVRVKVIIYQGVIISGEAQFPLWNTELR